MNRMLIYSGILTAILLTAWVGAAESKKLESNASREVVLVLGDSIAAGYGLETSQAFPQLLGQRIEEAKLPYRVVNGGLSGDTSAGGLRRLEWLLKNEVDILIIELGGNDGLRGIAPASTKANLRAIIDRAREKYPAIQVIIAGMQMPPNFGADYVRAFNQIYADLARETGALLIPFVLEGVGGKPELNLPDRIHPTAEGQKIVADNVWKVLQPLLTRLVDAE